MPIISISLSDEFLAQMDRLKKETGFAGTSELIRAGLRMMIADKRNKDELVGRSGCVLVVTHLEESEGPVTRIKHEFDRVVKTHIHYKLGSRKCLELFILEGESGSIREIVRLFQTSKGMDNVSLIRT